MSPSSSSPPGDSLPEPQSSRSIAIPSKHPLSSSSEATTRCGCRCGGCTCSLRTCCNPGHSVADSNREAYGGQGTNIGAASNNVSNLNASSLEAQGPKITIVAPPSLEILSKLNECTPRQLAESRTEQYLDDVDDDAPWLQFLSQPSMTSDAPELSGMFFGAPDMEDGSMENNPASHGSGSMLSSYVSGLTSRGEAAGAIVQHAGAALTNASGRSNSGNQRNLYLQVL
ncbi:hypothetical protein EPUS_04694 [Endocarpon pusillum Z07020]|uniref:Uncharacterized protein n=1 Tax=Endocarpon pusillum (strain Z07020 / HMAS-L-300199) TaxID=1263415 RepID=U1GA93_ENDPU|nr:uncharacterized protein EPUS_04694 [Endocarpon pusillum Z07020]ERF68596.1 hypothetical protein EPUS_04694 [Endocarpon pusillum Z07020]